jgi:hypothetical protein
MADRAGAIDLTGVVSGEVRSHLPNCRNALPDHSANCRKSGSGWQKPAYAPAANTLAVRCGNFNN